MKFLHIFQLELDFVLPFVKLPIFGVGPLIELDAQSITAAFTAIVFLYIVPKLLFLLYPNYQLPPAPAAGPDRGKHRAIQSAFNLLDMQCTHPSGTNSCFQNMKSEIPFLWIFVNIQQTGERRFKYHGTFASREKETNKQE